MDIRTFVDVLREGDYLVARPVTEEDECYGALGATVWLDLVVVACMLTRAVICQLHT